MAGFQSLAGLAEFPLVGAFLLFLRIGAMVAFVPGFGEVFISVRVKFGIAVAYTAIIWPLVVPGFRSDNFGTDELFLLALSETAFGMMLGLAARFAIHAVQIAGTVIAQSSSLSQMLGVGAAPDPMPALGNLLIIGAIALAMVGDMHVKLALALASSYQSIALGSYASAGEGTPWMLEQIASYFSLAFSLAAPFLCFFLLINVAFGVVNRAMPALMVSYIFAPFVTLAGLLLLIVLVPLVLQNWIAEFDIRLSFPFG